MEKKTPSLAQAEEMYKGSVEKMCDEVLAAAKEGYHNPLETWENFEEKKRQHLQAKAEQLKTRFIRGFQAIMKELQKESA